MYAGWAIIVTIYLLSGLGFAFHKCSNFVDRIKYSLDRRESRDCTKLYGYSQHFHGDLNERLQSINILHNLLTLKC